ncbi:hypothetical protein VNO77_03565 [Canavalia gladiata]|uniref:Uncharacterized protein n=1 Tax=Canavalia gladiata TaxID=3824 RepID=A0AAN9MVJ7_CANGL
MTFRKNHIGQCRKQIVLRLATETGSLQPALGWLNYLEVNLSGQFSIKPRIMFISLPKKQIQTKGCIIDFNSNHGRIAQVLYSVCSGSRLHDLGKPSELGKQFKLDLGKKMKLERNRNLLGSRNYHLIYGAVRTNQQPTSFTAAILVLE